MTKLVSYEVAERNAGEICLMKKGKKILVVDDEADIGEILTEYLTKIGHYVKYVDNGTEAIQLLKDEEFDLVLCDYVMPDISGHDVIKALDELDKRPRAGMISGCGEVLWTKELDELKIDFIINKPFDLSEISKHIDDIFGVD